MSDSFDVDPRVLGQIPATIGRARAWLGGARNGETAAAAAAAVPFGFGAGVADLGRSLDAFVAVGLTALEADAETLLRTAAAYERCEAEATADCARIGRRLGSSR